MFRSGSTCAIALLIASFVATSQANAAFYLFTGTSADGHAVSGSANFTLGVGTVTVQLTNLTALTLDAGELFTGIDFSFGGLTPSLFSASGVQRNVDKDGGFVDSGSPQNISWSIESPSSGIYQLNFHDDATDSIIGPPTDGSYSGATGSIKGNKGHNPFVAETATFVLNVPGLSLTSPVNVTTFRYGTTLQPATGNIIPLISTPVPEPATWMTWGGICAIGLVIFYVRRAGAKAAKSGA